MFAKSILFTSLLVCSFSVFVNAKNSDALDPDSIHSNFENEPTSYKDECPSCRVPIEDQELVEDQELEENEREELIEICLSIHEKIASKNLIKNIVELTDGYTVRQIIELMGGIINESEENALDKASCLEKLKEIVNRIGTDQMKKQKLEQLAEITYKSKLSLKPDWISEEDLEPTHDLSTLFPTNDERDELVKVFLSSYKKSAPKNLIKDIVELTKGYTTAQIAEILIDIMSISKENDLEQSICIDKLEEAINRIDTDQIKQQKLAQLKEMACELFKPIPFNPDWLKRDVKPYEADPVFPTADERLKIVKEVLLEHKEFASESLMQKVVEQTSGCDESCCRSWVTSIVEISKSSAFKQERYLERPTPDERRGAVEEVLLLAKKSAPESLIQDIVELTEYYDIYTITKLVNSMTKKSKTDSLDRGSCIATLRKAFDSIDKDEVKKFKLAQIEAMPARESLSKIVEQKATIEK